MQCVFKVIILALAILRGHLSHGCEVVFAIRALNLVSVSELKMESVQSEGQALIFKSIGTTKTTGTLQFEGPNVPEELSGEGKLNHLLESGNYLSGLDNPPTYSIKRRQVGDVDSFALSLIREKGEEIDLAIDGVFQVGDWTALTEGKINTKLTFNVGQGEFNSVLDRLYRMCLPKGMRALDIGTDLEKPEIITVEINSDGRISILFEFESALFSLVEQEAS